MRDRFGPRILHSVYLQYCMFVHNMDGWVTRVIRRAAAGIGESRGHSPVLLSCATLLFGCMLGEVPQFTSVENALFEMHPVRDLPDTGDADSLGG